MDDDITFSKLHDLSIKVEHEGVNFIIPFIETVSGYPITPHQRSILNQVIVTHRASGKYQVAIDFNNYLIKEVVKEPYNFKCEPNRKEKGHPKPFYRKGRW